MRNKRLIIAATAAIFFGLIAAVSVSRYLDSAQAFTKDLDTVVVAKVEIPLGSRIIAEQLGVARFPKDVAPDGAFHIVDENLLGRVAVVRIAPREPITESRLAPVGTAGGLSSVIPNGFRAMTVRVDEVVGVSGFIMPGTLVDIVVVTSPPKSSGQLETISKIVLQNIKVLASGQNIDKPQNDREVDHNARAVTLQVTPEQAEKLALASSEGHLQLVMRNSIDQDNETTSGANKSSLLSGERAMPAPNPGIGKPESKVNHVANYAPRRRNPAPVRVVPAAITTTIPSANARPSVEVIEGAKKRNVDFP
jgi:pilus assembly protein CpaB